MKKILFVLALALVALALYKLVFKKEEKEGPKEQPIALNGSSDAFTQQMSAALTAYYQLKDALVKSDTNLLHQTAPAFEQALAAVPMKEVKAADTALVGLASDLQHSIGEELKKLTAAANLETARQSFQVVSNNLFDLLRTVQYKAGTVYQQYCPMAFENMGASWLSNNAEIMNPYFGDKMLHCGEIRDSLK